MTMRLVYLLLITLLATSCSLSSKTNSIKVNSANQLPINREVAQSSDADRVLIKSGQFSGLNKHAVSGKVDIYFHSTSNIYSLVITGLKAENRPQLQVYLSGAKNSKKNSLHLGVISNIEAESHYTFAGTNYGPIFDRVIVWEEKLSQAIGAAVLQKAKPN